jgi:hypothetical protein
VEGELASGVSKMGRSGCDWDEKRCIVGSEEKLMGKIAETAEMVDREGDHGDVLEVEGVDEGVGGVAAVNFAFKFQADAMQVGLINVYGYLGGGPAAKVHWNWGYLDVDGKGVGIGCGGIFEPDSKICRAKEGKLGDEIGGFEKDVMVGSDGAGEGTDGGADDVEGVADGVVKWDFRVAT